MSDLPPASRFDDGKAPDALRTIGEVSAALGVKQHVLRYWEQQFPMLRPLKRSGARRYYRPEDVALIERIDRLINREGYTLKGARAAIESGKGEAVEMAKSAAAVADTSAQGSASEILPQLRAVRNRLARALEAA